MKRFWFKQGFRLYAVALAVWGAWTFAWMHTAVEMSPAYLGAGWYLAGGFGAALAIGFYADRSTALAAETASERARQETFASTPLNEPLLGLYAAGLLGWAAVTGAWWLTGFPLVDATVIAGGWYAVAAVGAVLVVGLSASVLEYALPFGRPAARED